ncbi:MAG: hypothetical protein H6766_00125 [Candidatus Peribacteria bacterium]|nr:MAG: hypothetical protein H6766_00125 [Candidatus Peribacteria bacterium]
MDIATDKISSEIRQYIPHHQIDIINPDETYTAGERQHNSTTIIDDIITKNHKPFIVGGT